MGHFCLAGGLSCGSLLLLFLGEVFSIPPSLLTDSEVAAGENGLKQRTQIQNGGKDAKFFSCFQLICRPKSEVSTFQQKAFKSFLYLRTN